MNAYSLRIRKAVGRLRRNLLVAAGLVVLISAGFALFAGDGSLVSALVGGLGGLSFMGFTWFSTVKMAASEDLGIGWLALDYLAKLLITLGLVLFAKNTGVLLPRVVGLILVAAILANMIAQVTAFASKESPSS